MQPVIISGVILGFGGDAISVVRQFRKVQNGCMVMKIIRKVHIKKKKINSL